MGGGVVVVHKKKKKDPADPESLNFDHDEEKGPSDHLQEPFMTSEDMRGDNKDDQYYEEEEAISPEENQLQKEEDNI